MDAEVRPLRWSECVRRAARIGEERKAGGIAPLAHGSGPRRAWAWGAEAWWWLAGGIAVLAFGLGTWGALEAQAEPFTWAGLGDAMYRALTLFTLNGPTSGDMPAALYWARFVAPAASVLLAAQTVLALLRERMQRRRLRRVSGHVVVCGIGRRGAYLAEEFLRAGEAVVLIDRDPANARLAPLEALGGIVLTGDGTRRDTLEAAAVARARYVLATCGSDSANAGVAMRAFEIVRGAYPPPPAGGGRKVRCFAHVSDPELKTLLRGHEILNDLMDVFELRLFDTFENAARILVADDLSPRLLARNGKDGDAHLVVVGFGRMGEAVAVQAARMPMHPDVGHLVITVLDRQAKDRGEELLRRYPGLPQVARMRFEKADISDGRVVLEHLRRIDQAEPRVSAVVVSLPQEHLALATALALQSFCGERGIPLCVRLTDEHGLADLVERAGAGGRERGDVRAFGELSQLCSREVVVGEMLDTLARRIHDVHVRPKRAAGKSPKDDPSLVDWDVLPEGLRDSNRGQADHLPVKLARWGRVLVPLADRPPEPVDPAVVEDLARTEHARWCAERLLAGWTYGPVKNVAEKKSPSLVPYDALTNDVQEWDRQPVRAIPDHLVLLGVRFAKPPAG